MEYTVRIAGTPCETRVSGGTLAEACALLGHPLELVCGGNGRCGKCDVLVERRGVRETVRACITPVTEDITVFLKFRRTPPRRSSPPAAHTMSSPPR